MGTVSNEKYDKESESAGDFFKFVFTLCLKYLMA